MGLLDDLNKAPQLPEENEILKARGESLEVPSVAPETPEEAMLVARNVREQIEDEEGMKFGKPVDFAQGFNNTIIAAAGAPVDIVTWALNKASNAVAGKDLIDPETAVGGSRSIKKTLNPVGIGSDEEADTYLGYAGNTFGEAAAFLAGGAAIVQKTKQAGGFIGSISKSADKALRTKLDDVVAVEATAALGMAGGRQYAEENEMGATGSLLLEFVTGALTMVSGAAAKKAILDPLTAKLKNMSPTEALEKLSKEEVAEVVARGRQEKAKTEPEVEAPKEAPEAPATAAEPTPAPKKDYQIESVLDEDGEVDFDADEALRNIAKERDLGITSDREANTLVRNEDGEVIGGTFVSNDGDNYTFDVVVSEAADGTGVGSKLLDDVIEMPYELREMNPDATMQVDVVSPKMKEMLERRGFEVKEEIGKDRWLMEPKDYDNVGKPKIAEPTPAPKTPEATTAENIVTPDINPNYKKGGGQKKIRGYNVKAKDGRELYIEVRTDSDIPRGSKVLVSMEGDGLEAFPTKKEALDWIDRTNEIKTPEATPAPKTDAEIEAMSDDELLAELEVEIPKPKEAVPEGAFRSELDDNIYTKKAELEDGVSIESGRIAGDGDLNNLPEGLRKVLEPVKDKIQRLNVTIGKNGIGLDTIVVQKSSRGKGVGAQIINDIIAYADSQNLPIVLTPSNKNAAKLDDYYKRLGFVDNKDGLGKQKLIRKPAAPEVDPIDASIKATREILEGDRSGGKGAQVTRQVKTHFRAVAQEFFSDINTLIKNKDVKVAEKILARIDKYIEFDRVISEKDYAQGSELVANRRNAMDFEFQAGISAAGNKRTEDLNVLKGMLQKLVDEDAAIDPKLAKKVADDAKTRAEGAPKLSKEEKLDAIADQVAKTFVKERGGVFQQVIDGYFTVRLTQMLNQAKTAFVGVPSATFMSVVRPLINTPYNIAKAAGMKGKPLSRRVQYAAADIAGTYEYVRMLSKHLKDTLRSAKDTVLNKGDSNFLYRDRNAYIKDQLAEASEPSHTVKRRLKQAQRRVAAANAKTETGRKFLNAKATVMNSKLAGVPAFFFDYGVSLIGGIEEVSLIAHSMRAARAQGIKKGIDEGVDDVWKFSEDYMESAFDRSRGGLQAKYDPEFADVFNTARRDHFRAMDLDPSDIRKDMIDGVVAGLNKVSSNADEMGFLARTLFVFIGVPMRALGANLSYIASPLNVAKNVTGGGARRLETAMGGTATFGKYNKKISEVELQIKEQKQLLKSQDPEVVKTAEKKVAELEDSLAYNKDLKMQKDYEDLGKLAIGSGLFFLGYEMAKNGQVAGTDSWMTEEQKFATQKVQGAPNSWKVVLGGNEYDFKYFEPLKGVFALGADYARRQAAEEAGALTDDQTFTQFLTSVTKSIATDSPFATGARYMTQIMSPNPDTQERGVLGVVRSLIPVPAEVRNFNKFDEEFVTDTTAGEFGDTVLSASLGQETGNYRLTSLGEPKIKEEPSILSYMLPFGPKAIPEREEIDDILLEDAMSFRSVSAPQTSISGFKLKGYTNEDNETLYSLYGRLITETRIDGKTQRQALNALVKTRDFKDVYNNNKYTMDDKGTEINEGIEMIKDIIAEYRAEARRKILETKAAADYVDGDGNNIYDILKEREAFDEQPESLLESLNLK